MNKKEVKYLLIKKENGIIDKKRILTIFEIEKFNKDYVIFYDEDILEKLYIASYTKNSNFKNLNTILTEEEIKYANKIIEVIKKDDNK